MDSFTTKSNRDIPAFLRENGKDILVPIKIDITFNGARLVDTFSWNLYNSCMTAHEFALMTCIDMNLARGFQEHIVLQLQEQIVAYKEIVQLVRSHAPNTVPNWAEKVRQHQVITMGIRHNTLDYTDKISWDPMSDLITPEEFAYVTAKDLGLPKEMRPAISNKIRETLFRWVISLLEHPETPTDKAACVAEFKVSDTKTALAQAYHAVEMANSLWKRAKPNTIEETAAVPQPLLPDDKNTNSSVWLS